MARLIPYSLRNQLLLTLALGTGLLALFCIPLWRTWHSEIDAGRMELLNADAARMRAVLAHRGLADLKELIADRVGNELGATRQAILLTGPDGRRLAGNLAQTPPPFPRGYGRVPDIDVGGRHVTLELLHTALPGGYQLWVGRDITRFERLEAMFERGMVGSIVITLLAAGLAVAVGRRSMLSRIHTIHTRASRIVAGDLSQRLPVSRREDEIDLLAATVNRMLEQIEHLVDNVRHASNAIAHDLRTPLAELRANLEHLAVTRPPYTELSDGLDLAIEDLDRLIGIFNAMLRLAEIDSGTRRAGFRVFDPVAVAQQAAEFYAPLAEDSGVELVQQFGVPGHMNGDPVLLAQALGNLIDNALKYAAGGAAARVTVAVERAGDGQLDVIVADNGPGLREQDRLRAAERFFRADESRATPGVGLGLALVSAVARLHGGSLLLLDNGPGMRAVLRFPPAAERHAGQPA